MSHLIKQLSPFDFSPVVRTIGCLLLLLVSLNCQAKLDDHRYQKSFGVQKLSIEQGLSQSVVYDITQDEQGYIWIATEDGLNRFDGYEFKIFEHKNSDPTSLHENLIYSLYVEGNKGLWLGTQNGLSFYDFKQQQFVNFNKLSTIKLAGVSALQQAADKRLFIGSENGLFIINSEREISLFKSAHNISIDDEVIAFDLVQNTLWLTTQSCVYSIKLTDDSLTNYCLHSLKRELKDRSLRTVNYFNQDLWLGTDDGLILYQLDSNQVTTFQHDAADITSLSGNVIQSVKPDRQNQLWVGTTDGVSVYNPATASFTRYQNKTLNQDGLSSNDIMSIFIDDSDLVWLGTYTGGVNLIDPKKTNFNHLLLKSELVNFNAPNVIHGITKDHNDNLWLASYGGGLLKLNMMTGDISQPFELLSNQAGSKHPYIYSLLIDHQQHLWVGVTEGLKLIDLKTEQLYSPSIFIDGKKAEFDDYVFTIYQDHLADIWIGTIKGFYQVKDIQHKGGQLSISLINKTKLLPASFREHNRWVVSIIQTSDGDYWLGGPAGLVHHNVKNNQWTHYQHQDNNPESLSYDDVQVIYEDSRSSLWVGTAHGLNKVNREPYEALSFERITKENGLSNNVIYGILEGKDRQLWLSTNFGLIQYSKNQSNNTNYSVKDGLSSNEFNKSAFYTDELGRLYFGSINGITMIDRLIVKDNEHQSNIKLTALQVGERTLNVDTINRDVEHTIIKYQDETMIQISITDLYYKKLGNQQYRYRLLGLSEEWIELGFERHIVLANLREGIYQLQVQSSLVGEKWNQNSFLLKINVEESFWQSRLAIPFMVLLIFILFVIIVLIIHRYYTKAHNRTIAKLKQSQLRLREAKIEKSELQKSLRTKVNEVDFVQNDLQQTQQELEWLQLKNPTTGFFTYANLETLLEAHNNQRQSSKKFNLVMVMQITQYKTIIDQHGSFVAAECVEYISQQLRRSASSDSQICSVSEDIFVLFANTKNDNKITQTMQNFQTKMAQTQIPVANGMMVNSGVGISYLEIYPDNLSETPALKALADIIIGLHKAFNKTTHSRLMRIDLNKPLDHYVSGINQQSMIELVECNDATLHFLTD
jgi:ligand-binding sensor domain-containing protein/GGDEF domain-containing protein